MTNQDAALARGRRKSTRENNSLKNSTSETKRSLYHCNYCTKDISTVARVKCAVCPDFDLCLECFSVGAEIHPHKSDHDYRVVDNLSFPIYHSEWGADEETLLLEAVDIYGLGNWQAVSEHVGNKGPQNCKQHYYDTYILVDSFPLPTPAPELAHLSKEELRAGIVQQRAPTTSAAAYGSRKRPRLEGQQAAASVSIANAPSSTQQQQAQQVDRGEVQSAQVKEENIQVKEDGEGAAGHGSKGLLEHGSKRPKHAAKEHVVDQTQAAAPDSAEQAHAQISERTVHVGGVAKDARAPAAPADSTAPQAQPVEEGQTAAAATPGPSVAATPASTPGPAAPLPVVQEWVKPKLGFDPDGSGYHFKRHDFDPEWDNDAECTIADMEFSELDTEEDRQYKLRMLHMYNKRLDERERRRNFIASHNLVRVKHFQALERRRTPQEREALARLRVFARYEVTPGEHEELVEGILLEQRLRARVQELKEYRRNGVRTLADADVFDIEQRRSKSASHAAALAAKAGAKSRLGGMATPLGGSAAALGPGAAAAAVERAAGAEEALPGSTSLPAAPCTVLGVKASTVAGTAFGRSAAAALQSWRSRRGLPLDITCLPGVEALGRRERELCAMSRMLPVHYLALKDMMMRDCQKHGAVTRQEARTFFRLDPQRCLRLYDLWTSLGWVSTGQKAAPPLPPLLPSPAGPGPAPVHLGLQLRPDASRSWPFVRPPPVLPPTLTLPPGFGSTPGPASLTGPTDWPSLSTSKPGSAGSSGPAFGLDLSAFPGASTDSFRGLGSQAGGGAGGFGGHPLPSPSTTPTTVQQQQQQMATSMLALTALLRSQQQQGQQATQLGNFQWPLLQQTTPTQQRLPPQLLQQQQAAQQEIQPATEQPTLDGASGQ